MKPGFIMATIIGVLLTLSPSAVMGQSSNPTNCLPTQQMYQVLAEQYGESSVGIGMVNEDLIIQLFVSHETDSWSVVATGIEGVTCLVSSGTDWEFLEITPPEGDLN